MIPKGYIFKPANERLLDKVAFCLLNLKRFHLEDLKMSQRLSQRSIDFNGHRKKYYVVLPQVRNSVRPDSHIERFREQPQPYFTLLQKQLIALFSVFACLFLLAFELG